MKGKNEILKALIKEEILEFANQYDSDFSPLDEPVNFWLDRYIRSASRAHLVLHKERDIEGLRNEVLATFPLASELNASYFEPLDYSQIEEKLIDSAKIVYENREKEIGPEKSHILDRLVMLQVIDKLWIEHLTAMEHERLQAGWQTLRQMKSADAYKLIGYKSFGKLGTTIRYDVASVILRAGLLQHSSAPVSPMAKANMGSRGDSKPAPSGNKKVGRNDPCPCGSGKKYKHCHGK